MTIIAIGSPEALKQAQHQQKRNEKPSFRLIEDINAAAQDETLETCEHFAAKMQEIGYVKVWTSAFDALGKHQRQNRALIPTKQKVVAGAVAECMEQFASKHFFEGENLERTMDRIGSIYLLAQKVDRVGFVQTSFASVLQGHGLEVPDYLKLQVVAQKPRREEHAVSRGNHRPSMVRSAILANAPAQVAVAVRADGSFYTVPKKHKPIEGISDEERARREAAKAAVRLAKEQAKAAQKSKKDKGDSKNKNQKRK